MVRGPSARFLPLVLTLVLAPAEAKPAAPAPTAGGSVVSAFVWDAANAPVPDITVALRNLATARVEGVRRSDADGHVSFRGMEPGTYVLEVVDVRGAVVATGQTFSIDAGESVATFVRLGAKTRRVADLFTNVGAIAVATAAGLGATAVGTTGQPRSPGR